MFGSVGIGLQVFLVARDRRLVVGRARGRGARALALAVGAVHLEVAEAAHRLGALRRRGRDVEELAIGVDRLGLVDGDDVFLVDRRPCGWRASSASARCRACRRRGTSSTPTARTPRPARARPAGVRALRLGRGSMVCILFAVGAVVELGQREARLRRVGRRSAPAGRSARRRRCPAPPSRCSRPSAATRGIITCSTGVDRGDAAREADRSAAARRAAPPTVQRRERLASASWPSIRSSSTLASHRRPTESCASCQARTPPTRRTRSRA